MLSVGKKGLLQCFLFCKNAFYPFHDPNARIYTSVVTLALALVTLTPSCFARAMMSMRLREETLWAILFHNLD
jgi:hypothetical protein